MNFPLDSKFFFKPVAYNSMVPKGNQVWLLTSTSMFALKNFREIMDNLNSDTDFTEDDLRTFEEKVRLEFQILSQLCIISSSMYSGFNNF